MKLVKVIVATALLGLGIVAAAQDDGLKIFISADMEGVVGAVTGEQLSPGGFEYERYRALRRYVTYRKSRRIARCTSVR